MNDWDWWKGLSAGWLGATIFLKLSYLPYAIIGIILGGIAITTLHRGEKRYLRWVKRLEQAERCKR